MLVLTQKLEPRCPNATLVFQGCTEKPEDTNLTLLEPFGAQNLTGKDVRRRCLNPSPGSFQDLTVTRGTRPSGVRLDYRNVFCPVCSGSVEVQPLTLVLRFAQPENRPLEALMEGSQCQVYWSWSLKKCSPSISLPRNFPYHPEHLGKASHDSPLPHTERTTVARVTEAQTIIQTMEITTTTP
ncbi:hypothetical protein ACOMHN_036716 [Nucella lapillus]